MKFLLDVMTVSGNDDLLAKDVDAFIDKISNHFILGNKVWIDDDFGGFVVSISEIRLSQFLKIVENHCYKAECI